MSNETKNEGANIESTNNTQKNVRKPMTKKEYIAKLKRRNAMLHNHLVLSRIFNAIITVMFVIACIFTCIKINEICNELNNLNYRYNEIIATLEATEPEENDIVKDEDIITTEPEETTEEIPTEATTIKESILPEKFDFIPLDEELKEYIYTSAIEADIPAEVIFSLAWKESTYNPGASSGTNDHGLFQINECNFKYLSKLYGYTYEEFCEKIYDPYVCTDSAILILSQNRDNYHNDNWHHVLMRYNLGPSGAAELFNEGIYSTKYSRALLEYAAETFGFTDIELN